MVCGYKPLHVYMMDNNHLKIIVFINRPTTASIVSEHFMMQYQIFTWQQTQCRSIKTLALVYNKNTTS